MLILSLEASTEVSSVALFSANGLVAEYTLSIKAGHSERLLPAVHRILADTHLCIEDVEAVAVSVGPGSFTGVRIAVCTAKGVAAVGNKPLVAVSSLLGLARRFAGAGTPICSLLDARKGEVYAGTFQPVKGTVHPVSREKVVSPEKLAEEIREPTLLVGEGAVKYRSLFEERLPSHARFVPGVLNSLSAASVAEVGFESLVSGRTIGADALVPNYIRRSEAEIKLEKHS